jgi:hypothetical protein
MLQAITRRLKRGKRGISTVIVVMLSLVLIVIIVGNVVLWSYQMNQLDWEKMRENIAIVNATSVRDIGSFNPSQYVLEGSTSLLSGNLANLTSDDGVYMTFRSYYSGTGTSDFVDNNTSNVDSNDDIGTHSNFTAQQYGPDLINDTLTEGNTGTTSLYEYYNTGDDEDNGAWAGYKLCQTFNSSTSFNITSVKLLLYRVGSPGTVTVGIYATTGSPAYPTGSALTSGTTNGTTLTTNTAGEWREITLTTHTLQASTTYAIVISISGGSGTNDNVHWRDDKSSPTYANGMYGRSSSSGAWGTTYMDNTKDDMFEVWGTSDNYQLDIEERFTSVDTGAYANKELCIFAGTWSTSETLKVDVWNTTSSSWVNVIASLTKNAWNNVSIANLLTATVTIRFQGGAEISDTVQDSWNIDTTLLHMWSNGYTTEVEFIGSSNTETWSQLNWIVNSAWTTGSVNVTLQLYNFALAGYPTSGNGYIAYTSDSTSNTEESKSQTIDVNPTDFRNATGYWKIKVKGVKADAAPFDLSADLIEFGAAMDGEGTLFTFENEGSLTLHVVSLWVNNSTQHQRYDVNIFLNSGETMSLTYSNVTLPDKPYDVKVITERGNTAVFASD